jgi:hypothetical protein
VVGLKNNIDLFPRKVKDKFVNFFLWLHNIFYLCIY